MNPFIRKVQKVIYNTIYHTFLIYLYSYFLFPRFQQPFEQLPRRERKWRRE